MKGEAIVFWLLAIFTLASALLAVTSRQIFRSAIFLLFSLVGMAGIYFWMQYEFVAAVQIVVYAGGIAVLIIFSVFLTQRSGESLPRQSAGRKILAALLGLLGIGLVMIQIISHPFSTLPSNHAGPGVADIGRQMLSTEKGGYALPFEVVSILLLAAMVGCIVIAMGGKNSKT